MKLDKIYIKDAVRIRKEYISSLTNILQQEDILNNNKSDIDKIRADMENIVESDNHDVTKRLKLNEELSKIDKIVKDIQSNIKPHYDKIESLRVDADKLYTSIKERYPDITEEDIKKQIAPYINFK